MAKYEVYMTAQCEYRIEVEADDEESAIGEAFELKPEDVCVLCTGIGQPWTFTMPSDNACWDPYEVTS
jgi:hypothetical protein